MCYFQGDSQYPKTSLDHRSAARRTGRKCMRLQVPGIGIIVVALAAIGCSDRNQPLPAAPRMQANDPVSTAPTCNFKSLSQLATRYFNAADAKAVRGIITKMQDSG